MSTKLTIIARSAAGRKWLAIFVAIMGIGAPPTTVHAATKKAPRAAFAVSTDAPVATETPTPIPTVTSTPTPTVTATPNPTVTPASCSASAAPLPDVPNVSCTVSGSGNAVATLASSDGSSLSPWSVDGVSPVAGEVDASTGCGFYDVTVSYSTGDSAVPSIPFAAKTWCCNQ